MGGGILERARSTTLALLGVTAAVGLAMVSLALNQSWPLVPGSPIPGAVLRQEAVGKATVASRALAGRPVTRVGAVANRSRPISHGAAPRAARPPGSPSAPAGSTELVVSPSAPVGSAGGGSKGAPADGSPSAPKQPHQAPSAPVPAPQSEPSSPPAPTPVATESAPPAPTTAEAPGVEPESESGVPPWSHGSGHAYGRGDGSGGYGH